MCSAAHSYSCQIGRTELTPHMGYCLNMGRIYLDVHSRENVQRNFVLMTDSAMKEQGRISRNQRIVDISLNCCLAS